MTGHRGWAGHWVPPSALAPTVRISTADAPVRFVQQLGNGVWLHWSVVEVDARAVPGAQRARCLVFSRDGCIRRVWEYPVDWRGLDASGLAALSWHR